MKTLVLLLISLLIGLHFAIAQPGIPLTISGEVEDELGAKIPRAHIILRTDFSGGWSKANRDTNVLSDTNGNFSIQVQTGFYDLCVLSDFFTPTCKKIFVDRKSISRTFKLRADPEVVKRTADKVF